MKAYGKTQNDVDVEKMLQCRNIVKEILNFGVDENQKIQIVKLMAMELENVNLMKDIVNIIKSVGENADGQKLIVT